MTTVYQAYNGRSFQKPRKYFFTPTFKKWSTSVFTPHLRQTSIVRQGAERFGTHAEDLPQNLHEIKCPSLAQGPSRHELSCFSLLNATKLFQRIKRNIVIIELLTFLVKPLHASYLFWVGFYKGFTSSARRDMYNRPIWFLSFHSYFNPNPCLLLP